MLYGRLLTVVSNISLQPFINTKPYNLSNIFTTNDINLKKSADVTTTCNDGDALPPTSM
jgi:hypothetical protein